MFLVFQESSKYSINCKDRLNQYKKIVSKINFPASNLSNFNHSLFNFEVVSTFNQLSRSLDYSFLKSNLWNRFHYRIVTLYFPYLPYLWFQQKTIIPNYKNYFFGFYCSLLLKLSIHHCSRQKIHEFLFS